MASKDIQNPLFLCISLLLGTYQLSKKSAPRPHLDGTLWHNGYHCCKKQHRMSSFLQPLREKIATLREKKEAHPRGTCFFPVGLYALFLQFCNAFCQRGNLGFGIALLLAFEFDHLSRCIGHETFVAEFLLHADEETL